LSLPTLRSYKSKAAADLSKNGKTMPEHKRRARKRGYDRALKGIDREDAKFWKEEIESVIDAMDLDLTEEQLAELKKSTMASYVKKAGIERDDAQYNMGHREGEGQKDDAKIRPHGDIKKFEKKTASWHDLEKHTNKRRKGIDRAVSKLAKEEVEALVLDELKSSTYASYTKSSVRDRNNISMGAKDELLKGNISTAIKTGNKIERRDRGLNRAARKITREEVESIDELSRPTTGAYLKKATHDLASKMYLRGRAPHTGIDKPFKKIVARTKHIDKAIAKLTKEEVDSIIDAMNLDLSEEQLSELKKQTLRDYAALKHQKIVNSGGYLRDQKGVRKLNLAVKKLKSKKD
jgi:hypothetical protein